MLPILVHETIPGHHYQLSYVLLSDLDEFRKYIAWGHYAQGAFNFPYDGSYAEVNMFNFNIIYSIIICNHKCIRAVLIFMVIR